MADDPFGIYGRINPGYQSTGSIAQGIQLAAAQQEAEQRKMDIEYKKQQLETQKDNMLVDLLGKAASAKDKSVRKVILKQYQYTSDRLGRPYNKDIIDLLDKSQEAQVSLANYLGTLDPTEPTQYAAGIKAVIQGMGGDASDAADFIQRYYKPQFETAKQRELFAGRSEIQGKQAQEQLKREQFKYYQDLVPFLESNPQAQRDLMDFNNPEKQQAAALQAQQVQALRKGSEFEDKKRASQSLVAKRESDMTIGKAKLVMDEKILPSKIELNRARAQAALQAKEMSKFRNTEVATRHIQNKVNQIDKDYEQEEQVGSLMNTLSGTKLPAADLLIIKGINQFFDSPRVTDSELKLVGEQTRGLFANLKVKLNRAATVEGDDPASTQYRARLLEDIQVADIKRVVNEMLPVLKARKAQRKGVFYNYAVKNSIDPSLVSADSEELEMLQSLSDKLKVPGAAASGARIQQTKPAPSATPQVQTKAASPAFIQAVIKKLGASGAKNFLKSKGFTFKEEDIQ